MGNHTQEHIKLCPYNLDYKQTTLRFGYYLLFRMPISKRRRLRILNLSVKTRLSTDKLYFTQLVRKTPHFHGQSV